MLDAMQNGMQNSVGKCEGCEETKPLVRSILGDEYCISCSQLQQDLLGNTLSQNERRMPDKIAILQAHGGVN